MTSTTTFVVEGGAHSRDGPSGGNGERSADDDDEDDEDDDESEEVRQAARLDTVGPAARGAPKIRYAPGELLVRFHPGTSSAEMRAAANRAGGTLFGSISKLALHLVRVPPNRTGSALASLRSERSVQSVEREVLLEALDTVPNDALWSTQWGWRVIGAPRAWDTGRGAPGVVIAVLDTGVDAQHPDLAGATVTGRDLVDDDSDTSDDNGHGTGAAGVIAARTNNREGQSGVCWACSLMPVRVLDSSGRGRTSTIAAGIVWAVDRGAAVLNMSLGGPGTTSALQAAVNYAASKGAVLVASAGNSGVDTPFYPAAYAEVIGVAATTEDDTRYSWSNYGSWVQVAAPGCNTAPRPGEGYVEFCGTSSAAPMVSGLAGLAIALNPKASRVEVGQAIAQSATPLPGSVRFGRVNAPSTMSAVASTGTSTPTQAPPAPPVATPPAPIPPAAAPPAPVVVAMPASLQPPRLRGRARVGRPLRVTVGSWSADPVRFAFAWQRCAPNGKRCQRIARAAKATYRLTRRDRGRRMRALVTATNASGSGRALTAASSIVRASPKPARTRRLRR